MIIPFNVADVAGVIATTTSVFEGSKKSKDQKLFVKRFKKKKPDRVAPIRLGSYNLNAWGRTFRRTEINI